MASGNLLLAVVRGALLVASATLLLAAAASRDPLARDQDDPESPTASGAIGQPASTAIWSWGVNTAGQLGDGTFVARPDPVRVAGPRDVAQVAVGIEHSLALAEDGTMWSWGENSFGEL